MLAYERLRELLNYDPETGIFTWLVPRGGRMKPGDVAGGTNGQGYRHIGIDRRCYKAHRLAWFYMTGAWPKGDLDHRDLDKRNNRLENLRPATDSQNHANTPAMTTNQGFKGAYFIANRKKWQASITVDMRSRWIGYFDTPEEAHAAYCEAAGKFFGEFARGA